MISSTSQNAAAIAPSPSTPGGVREPSALLKTSDTSRDVPSGLRCKLTDALLEDAVLAEDGYTYNRPAWQAYVHAHPHALVSPKTVQPVAAGVMPSRHLRNLASEWRTWHAAQPPHPEPFDLSDWVEDNLKGDVMREPVALPDGMVCDLSTARDFIFGNPLHPGRSLIDATVTFDTSQKVLRDLNVLELAEEALEHAPGTLSRTYVVPSIGAMMGSRAATLNVAAPAPAAHGAPAAPAAPPAPRPRRFARVARCLGAAGPLLLATYIGVAVAPTIAGVVLSSNPGGYYPPAALTLSLCAGGPVWFVTCLVAPRLAGVCLGPRVARGAYAV